MQQSSTGHRVSKRTRWQEVSKQSYQALDPTTPRSPQPPRWRKTNILPRAKGCPFHPADRTFPAPSSARSRNIRLTSPPQKTSKWMNCLAKLIGLTWKSGRAVHPPISRQRFLESSWLMKSWSSNISQAKSIGMMPQRIRFLRLRISLLWKQSRKCLPAARSSTLLMCIN